MKDALSVEQFKQKLEGMKASGLFRDTIPGIDPKKPVTIDISFLPSGNYLLVVGSREWVDANIEAIRLMGYLFERPRAHLQLNLRVVQLTGPANGDVIQMAETVRALVDSQRDEVVRTFADLEEYLMDRYRAREPESRKVYDAARQLLPALAAGDRPLTVPELLLMLMLDRASPAPHGANGEMGDGSNDADGALMELARTLGQRISDPRVEDAETAKEIQDELEAWKKAVTAARDWSAHYMEELAKNKDAAGLKVFREALQHPETPLPSWLVRRIQRSMEMTERLYPNLLRRQTEQSLEELHRRFSVALQRAEVLQQALARGEEPPPEELKKRKKGEPEKALPTGRTGRTLLAIKSLAEELVPAPLALFEAVALASDNSAPKPEQLIQMFGEYAAERAKLEQSLGADTPGKDGSTNYAKLQTLEAGLNLWLRRVSEAMSRALEQHFYRRYVNELRLLANKQLGKTSNRDILSQSTLDRVPDVARDLLLADTGVNVFLSNSISLQFAPEATNSVSAEVQSNLPSKQSILERVQQAETAAKSFSTLSEAFGIDGASVVKALLAGGQAVPVQGGINLSATPSVGFDAGTVTLSLTAKQTLQPNSDKVADRVTQHSIDNATVTALSYEPMVLSTLASNITYFEDTGGIPILRKTPILKDLAKDIPLAPFKQGKRQKGVFQSSVIILEPVVIPTIEDLVRFHGGWQQANPNAPKVIIREDEEDEDS